MEEITKTHWVGPYGVLVPNDILTVMAADGHNRQDKNGIKTEKFVKMHMTEELYKSMYAELRDGFYYYKPQEIQPSIPTKKTDWFVSFKSDPAIVINHDLDLSNAHI
jgi:hypothetical protein